MLKVTRSPVHANGQAGPNAWLSIARASRMGSIVFSENPLGITRSVLDGHIPPSVTADAAPAAAADIAPAVATDDAGARRVRQPVCDLVRVILR